MTLRCRAVVLLGVVAAGCKPPPAGPVSDVEPASGERFVEIIDIPRRTLRFEPTRDDITVGKAIVSIYCSDPEAIRVNGVQPDPTWHDVRVSSRGEIVPVRPRSAAPDNIIWMFVDLQQTAKNEFEIGPLRIESAEKQPAALICMSAKVWFNEVTNQYDGLYYEHLDDRYALVSYCTQSPDESPVKARFRQNRVTTPAEFEAALSQPMVIRLNGRALRDDASQ